MLRLLHQNGFSEAELLKVYRSIVLPCHDYCSTVFHSSLTLSQTTLEAIFGYDPSYRELMEKAQLTTLRARRNDKELRFARKYLSSEGEGNGTPLLPEIWWIYMGSGGQAGTIRDQLKGRGSTSYHPIPLARPKS